MTEAVARHLYKLMAYKDEYEVARLHLDPELVRAAAARVRRRRAGTPTGCTRRSCAPLGMQRKISLGPWFRPGFRTARTRCARLRGHPAGPVRPGEVRRTERALIGEYVDAVDAALAALTPATSDRVVELAALPDVVRGYEHVKLANVARFRERLAALRGDLGI